MLHHPTIRSLDDVRKAIDEIKRDSLQSAVIYARMLVRHGNATKEAKSYAADWLAHYSD